MYGLVNSVLFLAVVYYIIIIRLSCIILLKLVLAFLFRIIVMHKKILVVDDNRQMLDLMVDLLESDGHQVVTAEDGFSALDLLTSFTPDIIFVDLIMPKIGGDKLCKIVRKMHHLQDCYLVLVSAAAAELDFDYTEIGADACIAKGPSGSLMEHVIEAVKKADALPRPGAPEAIMGLDEVFPRQMTKELLSRNRHLETIIESMSEGILEIFSERIVYANSAAVYLFGLSLEKLLASYFTDLFDTSLHQQMALMVDSETDRPFEIGLHNPVVLNNKQVTIKYLPVKGEALTNIILITDVTERRRLQAELQHVQLTKAKALEEKSNRLQDANTALKVLLEQSEEHKKELSEDFLSNVKELVNPHLDRLKTGRLTPTQKELVNVLESNLNSIVSPFIRKMSLKNYKLTPKEIRVANLIKIGKKNKEIAEILELSQNTVLFHRFNIRTKLGLRNKKINLRSHLAAFDE